MADDVRKAYEERLWHALASPEPFNSAYAFVAELRAAGVAQLEVYYLFERVLAQVQEDDPRDDVLRDVMDCIVGWCNPRSYLFDRPLSNDDIEGGRDR